MFGINRGHLASAMKYLGMGDIDSWVTMKSTEMAYRAATRMSESSLFDHRFWDRTKNWFLNYAEAGSFGISNKLGVSIGLTRPWNWKNSKAVPPRAIINDLNNMSWNFFKKRIIGTGLPMTQRLVRYGFAGGGLYSTYKMGKFIENRRKRGEG